MGRKLAPVRFVRRTIKLSLHPERERHLIELIDAAPHKGRLVIDALEGRRDVETPVPADESDELREQLEGFLM
jgi:hypothetical protein